jgi:hypothetical protein
VNCAGCFQYLPVKVDLRLNRMLLAGYRQLDLLPNTLWLMYAFQMLTTGGIYPSNPVGAALPQQSWLHSPLRLSSAFLPSMYYPLDPLSPIPFLSSSSCFSPTSFPSRTVPCPSLPPSPKPLPLKRRVRGSPAESIKISSVLYTTFSVFLAKQKWCYSRCSVECK